MMFARVLIWELKKGRKTGIIYSYRCSRLSWFHYHSIISTALNLNNDFRQGVMYPQPTNVQGKALKDRTDFSVQVALS